MKNFFKKSLFLTFALSASLSTLSAQPAAPANQAPAGHTPVNKELLEKYVADSQKVVDAWLTLTDQGRYGESWDTGSQTFKLTISKKEWAKTMESLRKPLGTVRARKIIDIGSAENPKGLPPGEYMVYFYETEFSNKGRSSELLTLQLERDGKFRILTYQVL